MVKNKTKFIPYLYLTPIVLIGKLERKLGEPRALGKIIKTINLF